MPVIPCPHCRTTVDIHPDDLGDTVLCPNCSSDCGLPGKSYSTRAANVFGLGATKKF